MFGMTAKHYREGEIWYVFVTNANNLIAEQLIREEDFHDEFPVEDLPTMVIA